MAVVGSPSLITLMVSVDVKHHETEMKLGLKARDTTLYNRQMLQQCQSGLQQDQSQRQQNYA